MASTRTNDAMPSRRHATQNTDINRERFAYVLTQFAGKTVQAKLRNHSVYEGIFHSCNVEKDYSVVLKYARQLPSDGILSGPVIPTFQIPGKDYLCIQAKEIENDMDELTPQTFKTDAAISGNSMGGVERELEKWEGDGKEGATLDEMKGEKKGKKWDQFEANVDKFGVRTTYDENLYTTKLDVNAIPREKQEEAARIAKEIEEGPNNYDKEEHVEDEEAKFGAVLGTGAYKDVKNGSKSDDGDVKDKLLADKKETVYSGTRLSQETLKQHDAIQSLYPSGQNEDILAQHRQKRNLIHSPPTRLLQNVPMVSEMKGINALNLEPALPKFDEKIKSDFFKEQKRTTRECNAMEVRADLEASLQQIQERVDRSTRRKAAQNLLQVETAEGPAAKTQPVSESRSSDAPQKAHSSTQEKLRMPADPVDPLDEDNFGFQFNAHAEAFTPGRGRNGGTPPEENRRSQIGATSRQTTASSARDAQQAQSVSAPTTSRMIESVEGPGAQKAPPPNFATLSKPDQIEKTVDKILADFHINIKNEKGETISPEWREASGPSYIEILGNPSRNEQTLQQVNYSFGAYGGPAVPDMAHAQPSHGEFQQYGMENPQMAVFNPQQSSGPPMNVNQTQQPMPMMGQMMGMPANMERGDTMMMAPVPNQQGQMYMPQQRPSSQNVNDGNVYSGDMSNQGMQPGHQNMQQNQGPGMPLNTRGPNMMMQHPGYAQGPYPMQSMSMMQTGYQGSQRQNPGGHPQNRG